MDQNEWVFKKSISTNVNFLIQALMEEIKPLITDKNCSNKAVEQNEEHFSKISDYQVCDTRREIFSFLWVYSCTSSNVLIQTQLKKRNLIVVEKKELQHNGNSILIAHFSIPSIWKSQKDMFQ